MIKKETLFWIYDNAQLSKVVIEFLILLLVSEET